jgi:hypothetical protein
MPRRICDSQSASQVCRASSEIWELRLISCWDLAFESTLASRACFRCRSNEPETPVPAQRKQWVRASTPSPLQKIKRS